MKLKNKSQAGSLESNDVLVLLKPESEGTGLEIEIESNVKEQFGNRIREVVKNKLDKLGVRNVKIKLQDKGALDCTIEARIEAAVKRAQ